MVFRDPLDREVAALVASGLAYGRVNQILKSVKRALSPMGESPRTYIESRSRFEMERDFSFFKHRFTGGKDLVDLLRGMRELCLSHGDLQSAFLSGDRDCRTYVPTLDGFLEELGQCSGAAGKNSLICRPSDGSACKRHWLFLKWMVRFDAVDPGGWDRCDPARLVIPLDTHMHRIGLALGFTKRKSADLKAALEVTEAFAALFPKDPTRCDFALTRFGIRGDLEIADLLEKCRAASLDVNLSQDCHPGDEKQGEGQRSKTG